MPEPLSNEEREALAAPDYLARGGLSRDELLARVMDPESLDAERAQRELESAQVHAFADWLAEHDAAREAATEQRVREEVAQAIEAAAKFFPDCRCCRGAARIARGAR